MCDFNPIKCLKNNPHHIICRKNLLTSEVDYLAGITFWGRDNENIRKVIDITWGKFRYSNCRTFEDMQDWLKGIKKYFNDGNYHYYISSVSVSIAPIEQIEE